MPDAEFIRSGVAQPDSLLFISIANQTRPDYIETGNKERSHTAADTAPRQLGAWKWKGKIWVADDFDDLPATTLALFTGEADHESARARR